MVHLSRLISMQSTRVSRLEQRYAQNGLADEVAKYVAGRRHACLTGWPGIAEVKARLDLRLSLLFLPADRHGLGWCDRGNHH
jgi:hypothetical protein